jgi:dihydropteroate synthase
MSFARAVPLEWRTARSTLRLDRPVLMGIVNVTPDSFYDGGRHASVEAAVAHSERLVAEGADVLDVGGESTRPGASTVSAADEIDRVVPVVTELARRFPDVPLSIDTVKSDVADAALAAGAAIINDVSGLRLDARIANVAARYGAGLILMHSRGTVESMARYDLATYGDDVIADVIAELKTSLARAAYGDVDEENIVLDPGFGFSKKTEHSLALLAGLDRVAALGYPVMAGPSRKRFVSDVAAHSAATPAAPLPAGERLPGTVAACVIALMNGASIFRVHDVLPVRRALDLANAVRRAES